MNASPSYFNVEPLTFTMNNQDDNALFIDSDGFTFDESMQFQTTSCSFQPEQPDRFSSLSFFEWVQSISPSQPINPPSTLTVNQPIRPQPVALNEILSPLSPLRYQSLGELEGLCSSSNESKAECPFKNFSQAPIPDNASLAQSVKVDPKQSTAIKRRSPDLTCASSIPCDKELIKAFKPTVPEVEVLLRTSDRLAGRIEQTITRALSQSSKPTDHNTCDWLFGMAMLFEWAPTVLMERFLRRLQYKQHPIDETAQAPKRLKTNSTNNESIKPAVWIPTLPFLPRVTLPLSCRTDWSGSPVTTVADTPGTINMATLVWERPLSVKLYESNESFLAVSTDDATSVVECVEDVWRRCDISDVDLSYCRLPLCVQVNEAFERLFGLSQQQVRGLYMNFGTRAMYQFNDSGSMQSVRPKFLQSAVEGQSELSRSVKIKTPKGLIDAIVLQKLFSDSPDDATSKITYVWFPLPSA